MKARSFGNLKRGVSTLEILIAFAILSLTLTAAILVVFGNQSISIDTQLNDEALSRAQAQLENAIADSRVNWQGISTCTSVTSVEGIYKKVLQTCPDPTDPGNQDKQLASSTISWTPTGRPQLSVVLTTLLTNPSGGNMCQLAIDDPSKWANPQIYPLGNPAGFPTTELVKLSPLGSNANGLGIGDIEVYKKRLYLAASATAGNDTHTLFVADLPEDPNSQPQFAGWASTIGNSLNAIAVAPYKDKVYAYVANAYAPEYSKSCLTNGSPDSTKCAQLQIIDVTPDAAGKINPKIVPTGNVLIPATDSAAKPALAEGKSIFYYKGYIYLGLTTATGLGSEFNIIDVGGGDPNASPTNPKPKGTYTVGRTINSIYVQNVVGKTYAFLATDDNAGGDKELVVLDVSTKETNPLPKVSWGQVAGAGFGYAVTVDNGSVYLGRSYNTGSPTFYIYDGLNNGPSSPISSPLHVVGSLPTSLNSSNVSTVVVRGSLAFLLTSDQFQVWSIPGFTKLYSTDLYSSIGANGKGVSSSCSGSYIYIGAQAKDNGNNNKDVIAIIGPALKPTPIITWNNPAAITYGTALSATQLNASSGGVAGTFIYMPAAGKVLDAGTNQTLSVQFTPSDTNNYNTPADKTVKITVNQATPSISATIYNAATNQPAASVSKGTSVYDKVTLTGVAAIPSGTVNFTLYTAKTDCSGSATTYNNISLVNGVAQTPNYKTDTGNNAKSISYKVHYNGDANYTSVDDVCRPLTVN